MLKFVAFGTISTRCHGASRSLRSDLRDPIVRIFAFICRGVHFVLTNASARRVLRPGFGQEVAERSQKVNFRDRLHRRGAQLRGVSDDFYGEKYACQHRLKGRRHSHRTSISSRAGSEKCRSTGTDLQDSYQSPDKSYFGLRVTSSARRRSYSSVSALCSVSAFSIEESRASGCCLRSGALRSIYRAGTKDMSP